MNLRSSVAAGRERVEIRLCGGSGCVSLGALEVLEEIRREADLAELGVIVNSRPGFVGCRGFCSQGPLVHFPKADILYCRVKPDDVDEIIRRTVERGEVVERLLYLDPASGDRFRGLDDNPFFSRQDRQVLRRCGSVDPEDIEHAMVLGAYRGLEAALDGNDAAAIIDLVKRSGLQERGGTGFPVGLKWAVVAEAPGDTKYVIANGEGGDPGLTVDRTLLEGDPHSVIEGMVIAGFAVGARDGRLFLRSEHGLGVARVERALAQARRRGFVGPRVCGTDFDFSIEICESAGASMGGEETALLNALQGRRAVARPRPPFPAVRGLWGRPTLINSLETLANIPLIVLGERDGACGSPGRTKVVGLSGSVARPGLAEVPLGTSVRELVCGVGGETGVRAVHLGGPGGATLGPEQLETPIDFSSLRDQGAQLGSGGLVVLGQHECPVALARFLVEFCAEESCGTCPPCRIGTGVVIDLLDRVVSGSAEEVDLHRIERLCKHIRRTSLCELGRNASSSVLASLRNFRSLYESHLDGRGCSTGGCN